MKEGSAAQKRMAEYGSICKELNIIIPSVGGAKVAVKIADNVFAYPTASANRLFSRLALLGVKNTKADLVTAQDPFETGFFAWLAAKKLRAKLELQIHTDFLSPYFWRESFLNKIRVFLAKFILPKADCVRVVSQRISVSLSNVKCQMSNVSTLPIFVDAETIKNSPAKFSLKEKYPQFERIILMVSRLSKEKNIGLAIEAMKEVVKKNPKTRLVIVGSGPEENTLKLKVMRHNLTANIVFEGWQSDTISYYKGPDLFLSTSNYEGYGLTLLEAAISGCPIVTTDVGIAPELEKSGAPISVCPVGDAACLTSGIIKSFSSEKSEKSPWNPPISVVLPNKKEYLKKYAESWQKCLNLVR